MAKNQGKKIHELEGLVKNFCEERDWDKFHGAKDLAIALSIEASELLEYFRFKNYEEVEELFTDEKKKKEIGEEMADVLFFLTRIAQKYDIDLVNAFERKMEKNNQRYPVDKAKGSNKKYNEF